MKYETYVICDWASNEEKCMSSKSPTYTRTSTNISLILTTYHVRRHQPVMLQETIDGLPEQCSLVMDGTFGHGGHTAGMLK
jgi:hypothetical protein